MEPNDREPQSTNPTFGAGLHETSARPPIPPQEVEAVPLSPSEARGPSVDVHAERAMPSPPPPPIPAAAPSVSTPPPAPPIGTPAPSSPPNQTQAAAPIVAAPRSVDSSGRVWVVVCHLAYLIPLHLPGLALTTLIWIWRRRNDARIEDQAREAINMQLNFFAVNALLLLTINPVSIALTPLVWAIGAVMCVIAAAKSGDIERYRYPWIFRVIV